MLLLDAYAVLAVRALTFRTKNLKYVSQRNVKNGSKGRLFRLPGRLYLTDIYLRQAFSHRYLSGEAYREVETDPETSEMRNTYWMHDTSTVAQRFARN